MWGQIDTKIKFIMKITNYAKIYENNRLYSKYMKRVLIVDENFIIFQKMSNSHLKKSLINNLVS